MALVGCGSQGFSSLLPSLSRIRGVKITAVCDIRESVMRMSQLKAGKVQRFLIYDEMLEKASRDFDALFIATPCWMHRKVRANYQMLTTSSYEDCHEKVYGTEATAVITERFSGDYVKPEIYRERNTRFASGPGASGGVSPAVGSPVAKGEDDKRAF